MGTSLLGFFSTTWVNAQNTVDRLDLLRSLGASKQVLSLPGVSERLEEIRLLELELAHADYLCSEGHYERRLEIRFDAETKFLEDHGDRIAIIMNEFAAK